MQKEVELIRMYNIKEKFELNFKRLHLHVNRCNFPIYISRDIGYENI